LVLVAAACSGDYDPWSWYQPEGQETKDPEETEPVDSNVEVEEEDSSDDNIANSVIDGTISISFSSSGATVSGEVEGVSVTRDGAFVTATNSGDKCVKYILSGSSNNGCFKLYSSRKQAIVLDGLNLTNPAGAAINNQSGKRTFVVLQGTNVLSDGEVGNDGNYSGESSEEDMKAAFFSEGQLIFSGNGTLTVNAVGKAGITSDDYVRFMTGSNVTVKSSKGHGVRGKDAIIVSGGTINVTLESTASSKKCFTSDSLVFIGGGATTLVNKASCGSEDNEMKGSAGIKADKKFVIQGGEITITASGQGCKCISGDEDGFFEGGTVKATASGSNYGSASSRYGYTGDSVSSKGIKFDGNIEFSGATVIASASAHEAIESKKTIYISGGAIYAQSKDDAINSSSTMTISDGVIYAASTGNDGLDANGNLIIKGGTVFASGSGSPEVGIDANTEGGYKLYIQGGNIIALSGLESGSSVSQPVISTSWNKSTVYSLCDSDEVLFSFKTPSSGGTGLYMSSPTLVKGSKYTLKTSATITEAEEYFDGLISIGGKASGGNSASVSASEYSSSGGMGGGGGFPGGGGGPGGGRWW